MNIDRLKELVFTALGEASMCWNPRPTGVFDSTDASRVGEKLVKDIEELVYPKPILCGYDKGCGGRSNGKCDLADPMDCPKWIPLNKEEN